MKIFRTVLLLFSVLPLFAADHSGVDNDKKVIIFTGDSIACGVGASNRKFRFSTMTVDMLNKSAGKILYSEKNIAISGSTMTDQLWPDEHASGYPYRLKDIIRLKPDILVIQHGVNDYGNGMSLAGFAWSYRQFVREAKAALPDTSIICLTITPLGSKPGENVWINQANAAIQEIAAKENIVVAQVNMAFNNRTEFFPDFCHPNDAGHRIIAETAADAIRRNKVQKSDCFDFVMRSAGEYSLCGWKFTISKAAEKGGFTLFRNVGVNSFEYCSFGKISLASPQNFYDTPAECKSNDPAVIPQYHWLSYQRRSSWQLPSTNGKWVKITNEPLPAINTVTDFSSIASVKKDWIFNINTKTAKLSVDDGILTFDNTAAPGREIRITSRRKFKYARLEAKINFSYLGKDGFSYLGFVTPFPWHKSAVWLIACNTENGTMIVRNNRKTNGSVRSGNIAPGEWHDLVIDRAPDGASLYVNGVLRGKVTDKTFLPETEMPIMFILQSPGRGVSLKFKELKVTVY